eukprot:TRINITY_DN4356_c0_g2_i6.p1 TRINITY_DN4356_c0_g2~~TRINITY_DN4356_c0_g2_i6.p1  ORF type:complete len:172 (-),score=24.98 TRINITY_DN4356_c0_g2_i6:56-571(-)
MSIHTDTEILPKSIVGTTTKNILQSMGNTTCAHKILNYTYTFLEHLHNPIVVQTWSIGKSPARPETLLSEVVMNRQIHTLSSLGAADKILSLQGKHNVWFCGGYTLHRVPLLESGVIAACEIAKSFGVQIPWNYSKEPISSTNLLDHFPLQNFLPGFVVSLFWLLIIRIFL